MDALTVAARAVHYAAVVALFGESVFFLCAARPGFAATSQRAADETLAARRRMIRACAWCLTLVLASGALWLAVEAASMSGTTIAGALRRETLDAVLTGTLFGRTWIVRFALSAALAAALVFLRRAGGRGEPAMLGTTVLLAGMLLGSLAWAGHAAAERGADRIVHLSADFLHLLAAGAWLGALVPLAFTLARARRTGSAHAIEFVARVTRRFSTLGVMSVGVLVVTGVINAWYTLGSVPALLGTDYGRLLSAKLMLLGATVALAAINRLRLTPRLPVAHEAVPGDTALAALQWLRRNALIEAALGLGVLGVVGALGVTIPARHVQTIWPLSYTLDWDAAERFSAILGAAFVAPLVAFALLLAGLRARKRELSLAGLVVLLAGVAVPVWLLAVPAHPTTYFHSPERYTAVSIATGAARYAQHCASCHGVRGRGDGPAAASPGVKPPDLTAHLLDHSDGELYWWITHGIAGTPMPGFGARLSETEVWDTINFLRAQAQAEEGKAMNAAVVPWRPIVAPEFDFQIGHGAQESLRDLRGRKVVLVVIYTLPGSLARLRALSRSGTALERLGVLRIIAVPMRETDAMPRGTPGIDAAMLADPDSRIAAAYAVFHRTAGGAASAPEHVEFLVDRQGYLRARWMRGEEPGWRSIPELLHQAEVLNGEKPHAPARVRHAH